MAQVQTINIQSTIALHQAGSVLLATAMIGVRSKHGEIIMLRALLDQGSQSAFISENAAQTLKLKRESISVVISGIGAKTQVAKHAIELFVFPRFESDFSITTRAIVLSKLTEITPFEHDLKDFEFTNNLTLADPSFLRDSEIDIILGASEYASAIKSGLVKSEKNLIAQNSEFGWIVSGMINKPASNYRLVTMVTNVELTKKLNNFFDNSEFYNVDGEMLTEEEAMCEEIYDQTHCRDSNGRYIVTIPFKNAVKKPDLGDSKRIIYFS